MIDHFSQNTMGRDFAVGDIHGCFDQLQSALNHLGFDETRDRLFSVGDLIDRGPHSATALEWLDKPWFHAVRGNHEQMAIGVAAGRYDRVNYAINGGEWFVSLPKKEQQAIAERLDRLPYALDVDTEKGKVGVVHADIPHATWKQFCEALHLGQPAFRLQRLSETVLWSRQRISLRDVTGVPDLLAMIVGHTPVDSPRALGNVHYIDTGAAFKDGHITVIALNDLG